MGTLTGRGKILLGSTIPSMMEISGLSKTDEGWSAILGFEELGSLMSPAPEYWFEVGGGTL